MCRRLHPGTGKCPDCRAAAFHAVDRERGTTTERGYGWTHQQERARWTSAVAAGEVACSRCGARIMPGEAWDLDHDDADRSRYLGPAHTRCNRIAGALRADRHR